MAQNVTLRGKDFYIGNEKFYPMVMNYCIDWVLKGEDFFHSPHHGYGATNGYECNSLSTCSAQLQTDFNYIAGMGFNALRIMGLSPRYFSGQGLTFQHYPWPLQYFPVDPYNNSDPGLLVMLSTYDKILELAHTASLKVIFMLPGGSKTLDATEIGLKNHFLAVVSSYLSSSSYSNTLFAYDLINEPGYVINNPYKTKQEACEIVSTWYDIIKANDPQRLVTVGNYNIDDIFTFDPSILKVDFNSVHYYPHFKSYEDRTDPTIQQMARQRTANTLYWFNQASIVPWIVGETGFTASASHGIASGLNGTLADQGDYVQYTLDAICNCGGSGFSWWQYQDVWWGTPKEDFLGLLERANTPKPSAEKQPAVNHIRNYVPRTTGACPVDRTDTFNASKTYYNHYRYEYSANDPKIIKRHVKDTDGNPIKDAVVRVWVDMGNIVPTIYLPNGDSLTYFSDGFLTHTDINGYFEAIPKQFNNLSDTIPLPAQWPGIARIQVSAAGADVYQSKWSPGNLQNEIPSIIEIQKLKDYVVVANQTVNSGQTKKYSGRRSLTVSNTNINPGGKATFTSQKSVFLLPGFFANAGSDASIYIAPPDCDDLSSFTYVPRESNDNISLLKNKPEAKAIELSFENSTLENHISVYPNPANSTVTIQLHNSDKSSELKHIIIYDIFGREVFSRQINETSSYVLDVLSYPKGVYFIVASDATEKTYYQKLIIQ